MIIVSQNKTEIINFDNVMNMEITDCEEKGYLIAAGFIVGRDDNYRELGYYATEARAKEILIEIAREFKRVLRTENRGTGQQRFYDVPKVYYMPEK